MNRLFRTLTTALLLALPMAGLEAQSPAVYAYPRVRIQGRIDRNQNQTLRGTHPDVVERAVIGSRLAASTKLDKMILVLDPSEAQKVALHTLLDAQQDKGSASFHKWLTPDDFAAQFGIADSDVSAVSNWLAGSGLSVDGISKGGRFITFSGTAGAVESTFHTEMHHLTFGGEAHISNTTDIAIPAALATVVRGVKSLNDFRPKSNAAKNFRKITVQKNADGSFTSVDPLYGSSPTGTHYIGAADLATIYNATPLQQAGNTGKGVTIAVLARSNIQLSDVDTYRALFGLPKNTPNVIVVGSDPGQNGDDLEAYLDAEMAGSLATDATVDFIVSGVSLVGGDIDAAGLYAVDNNIGDIISLSYGGCESDDGQSGTAFWSQLWEQAAAQGQTPFVSSGDSGAAGCDSSSAAYATHGYGVNSLSSTGYSVSVGGTIFVDYNPSKYWGASSFIPYSTALSYIPEGALNQGRLATTYLNSASTANLTGSGIFSDGGGISIYSARPPWQKGSGIPTGSDAIAVSSGTGIASGSPITSLHRLQPDVSFISANGHDGTLFCAESSCYETATGGLASAGIVGGTSVAAPALASAQALIDAANGGRQGNANIYYYALADRQYTASTTACQSLIGTAASPATTLPAASCYFQDTVAGSNIVATASTDTVGIGFSAVTGYDEATGLGSPNIANLARDWKTVVFNATSTTLTLTPTTGTHGVTQNVTVQVIPASGSGTPTGDVSLIASQISGYGSPITLTLTAGNASAAINSLPAGTYTLGAHYAGDTNFAASDSAPVTVTITKEDSSTSVTPYLVTAAGNVYSASSFTYGAGEIYLDTEISPDSGYGTASGTVNFTVVKDGVTLAPLSTKLDTYGTTYLLTPPSFANFYLLANYAALSPGGYTVTANYSGDVSFNSSTTSSSFTVTKATPAISFTTSTAQIPSGATATLNFSITTPAGASSASGTVVFTDTTTGTALGTANLSNGAAVLNTSAITTSGANSISATYSGDTNYGSATSTVTVTVSSPASSTTTVGFTSGTLYVGTTVTLTATVSPIPTTSATVSFYDGAVLIGSSAASTSNGVATLAYPGFTAGTHTVIAKFAGTSTVAASAGTALPTINKNITSMRVGGADFAPYGSAVTLEGGFSRSPSTTAAPAVAPTGVISFYDGGSTSGTLLGSVTPVFGVGGYYTYEGSLSVSTLSVGSHSIVSYYPGDANYASSTSIVKPLTITQVSVTVPSITVTSDTTSALLSATISFAGTTTAPTGAVLFTVDSGTTLTATCSVSGTTRTCTANYPASGLAVGVHTITAVESGDTTYSLVSGTATLTVTGGQASLTTTSSITDAGNGNYLVTVTVINTGNGAAQSVVLTGVTVGSATGTPVPQSLGTIAAGASASGMVQVPASAGTSGSTVVEKVTGTYPGGSFGGSSRLRLPNLAQ